MKDRQSNEALVVLFSPRSLIGAQLAYNQSNSTFHLRTLHHEKLQHLELERLALFNPTRIGSYISSWYQSCNRNSSILFGLQGPALQEHILSVHTPYPNISHFPLSHAPHMRWEHTHLYSLDHRHCFYVCGISQAVILQYQLIALEKKLPLTLCTTERMALIHCYRYMYGTAYRQAQFAQSMQTHHNRIERLFFKEDLTRILKIPTTIEVDDALRLPLLTACGLFVMQGYQS